MAQNNFVWRLTEDQISHASNQFRQADSNHTGFLTGDQVREILQQQGLSNAELAQIWTLSDYYQDGKLNDKEFTVANFLIYARYCKQPLPDKLPESLVAFIAGNLIPQASLSYDTALLGSQAGSRATTNYPALGALGSQSATRPTTSSLPSSSFPISSGSISSGSTSVPSSALGSQPKDKFAISQQQYLKYKETFDQYRDETGLLGGAPAIELLGKSNLSQEVLASIWQLSDVNQDGSLNEMEFAIAMHLIHYKLAGGEIPSQLPTALLSSVKIYGAPSSGSSAPALNLPPIPVITLPDITISVPVPSIPQFETTPINPYPLSELSDKFGVSDFVMSAYDPSVDIQRTQNEVQNSGTAQQVLDQAEPELKNLSIKLETANALHQSLMDKSVFMNSQLSVAESQRQQITAVAQDFHNQMTQAEQELQQSYQELLTLKSSLESYASTMAVGDTNSLRQRRQQINQEQSDVTAQVEALRDERTRLNLELELIKKDIDRIATETNQIANDPNYAVSVNALAGTMSGMSLNMNIMGGHDQMLGPPVNLSYDHRLSISPTMIDPHLAAAFTDPRIVGKGNSAIEESDESASSNVSEEKEVGRVTRKKAPAHPDKKSSKKHPREPPKAAAVADKGKKEKKSGSLFGKKKK